MTTTIQHVASNTETLLLAPCNFCLVGAPLLLGLCDAKHAAEKTLEMSLPKPYEGAEERTS